MSDVMGLYLRANDIATIAPASFDQLTSLSHLDVSQNGLTDVSFLSGARHHLSLTFLDLSFNRIGSIDAKAFARLHKLRQLKLNNNPIVALDHHAVAAIAKLSKLVELNLAGTQLKTLPDGLFTSGKLRFLDLHDNRLMDVPASLQNAVQLRELNLNANPIRRLNAASFTGLTSLVKLEISMMSHLQHIEGNSFTPLRNLETLECSQNYQLRSIHPNAFTNVTTLKEFDFSSNGVGSIPPYLLHWNLLEEYSIQNNSNICTTLNVTICKSSKLVSELTDSDRALMITCVEEDETEAYSPLTGCPGESEKKPKSTTPSAKDDTVPCLDGCVPAATESSSLKRDASLVYLLAQLVFMLCLK